MKKVIVALIFALVAALVITTAVLAVNSNRRSDETIARVDQLIAEAEAGR